MAIRPRNRRLLFFHFVAAAFAAAYLELPFAAFLNGNSGVTDKANAGNIHVASGHSLNELLKKINGSAVLSPEKKKEDGGTDSHAGVPPAQNDGKCAFCNVKVLGGKK